MRSCSWCSCVNGRLSGFTKSWGRQEPAPRRGRGGLAKRAPQPDLGRPEAGTGRPPEPGPCGSPARALPTQVAGQRPRQGCGTQAAGALPSRDLVLRERTEPLWLLVPGAEASPQRGAAGASPGRGCGPRATAWANRPVSVASRVPGPLLLSCPTMKRSLTGVTACGRARSSRCFRRSPRRTWRPSGCARRPSCRSR